MIKNNLGREVPKDEPSKTMILIDATGSMSGLINKVITTIKDMLDQIKHILESKNFDPNIAEIKIAVYRNYAEDKVQIYQASGWETRHHTLREFLERYARASGGYGANEAVEVGLHYASKEIVTGLS